MDVYGTSGISNLTDFQNGHQNAEELTLPGFQRLHLSFRTFGALLIFIFFNC
jgi:hypothetical protein